MQIRSLNHRNNTLMSWLCSHRCHACNYYTYCAYVVTHRHCFQVAYVHSNCIQPACGCCYLHKVVLTFGVPRHRQVCTASATASPPAPSGAAAPAQQQEAPVLPFRVGYGFDLHRLVEGKKLIICGVDVPHVRGCDAHSDGKMCSALW